MDGKSSREPSKLATADILRMHARAEYILLLAGYDMSALGGLDALHAAGRDSGAAILGFGGILEALSEIANPESPYFLTVNFWPKQYGPRLIDLVIKLLAGEQVVPIHYIEHQLSDRFNIGRHFPTVLPQLKMESPAVKAATTEKTHAQRDPEAYSRGEGRHSAPAPRRKDSGFRPV